MSYEKVKSITRKKDGRVFITSVSNNVWPKDYNRREFMPEDKCDEEKSKNRMLYLFHGIIGQVYQFNESVNDNWKYALNKFYEYCRNNDIHSSDLWELPYEDGDFDITKLKPYYDKFNEFYEEKIEGEYFLNSDEGAIIQINENWFCANKFNYKNVIVGPYKKLYNMLNRLSRDMIEKHNIEVKDYNLEQKKEINCEVDKEGDFSL